MLGAGRFFSTIGQRIALHTEVSIIGTSARLLPEVMGERAVEFTIS
jgi:hypothetical protein